MYFSDIEIVPLNCIRINQVDDIKHRGLKSSLNSLVSRDNGNEEDTILGWIYLITLIMFFNLWWWLCIAFSWPTLVYEKRKHGKHEEEKNGITFAVKE